MSSSRDVNTSSHSFQKPPQGEEGNVTSLGLQVSTPHAAPSKQERSPAFPSTSNSSTTSGKHPELLIPCGRENFITPVEIPGTLTSPFPMPTRSQPMLSNSGSTPTCVYSFMEGAPAQGLPHTPVLFQNFGGSVSFPDIYEGDAKKWDEHFRTIQRAYKEFGKDADFAIRVLTEDFTLPFPYAWPPEDEQAEKRSYYDTSDCENYDFFLHPGKSVPRILQPLHATTQAYFKKRRLEQLALTYASRATPLANNQKVGHVSPHEVGSKAQSGFVLITGKTPLALPSPTAPPASYVLQDSKSTRAAQASASSVSSPALSQKGHLP
ncbi:uncharacterized protein C8orf90 homolog [Ambystoma mexicanum]|uniref:uncharacterized protein C8orf90 homolog n=1 Tax=Ambystoma mexicanum TaxID=8296 RepID=UPI0037E946FF